MENLTLGQKIKKARLDMNLTQKEVAKDFITRNMLSKIENDVATPSIKTIKYLAEKLNKPVSYFLNNTYDDQLNVDENLELQFEHSSFLIKNEEYDECISYISQILKTFDNTTQNVYYGRLLYNLAKCHIKMNTYNSIGNTLDKAIEVLKINKDYYYLADTYFYKSNVFFHNKQYKETEDYVRRSIEALGKSYINDIFLEIKLFFSLGFSLYKQNKYEESITVFNCILELSIAHKCFYNFGDVYMLLGIIYKRLNDLEKAINYTSRAISFYNSIDELCLKASCQKNLGNFYLICNDFDNALHYLNESLKYFNEIQDINKVHTIKSDILELLVKKGDFTEAIEYVNQIDLSSINIADQARVFTNLSKCYIHLQDFTQAKDCLIKSESLLKETHHYDMLYTIYDLLSHMYSLSEDYENAYKYSIKSKEFLEISLKKGFNKN